MEITLSNRHQNLRGELVGHLLFDLESAPVVHIDEHEAPLVVCLLQVVAEFVEQSEVVATRCSGMEMDCRRGRTVVTAPAAAGVHEPLFDLNPEHAATGEGL
ncbi:hypothetical protein M3E09_12980 [Dietzia cinnamea]|nr:MULTISPECIES: hypothetical protein [Dietzia]MCT2107359.1 hypothetical protein [Dietzia cinnamea]